MASAVAAACWCIPARPEGREDEAADRQRRNLEDPGDLRAGLVVHDWRRFDGPNERFGWPHLLLPSELSRGGRGGDVGHYYGRHIHLQRLQGNRRCEYAGLVSTLPPRRGLCDRRRFGERSPQGRDEYGAIAP